MHFRRLILYSNQLDELEKFYGNKMGFPVKRPAEDELKITAGKSEIVFHKSDKPRHYHFAFNIPPQQVDEAKKWLEKRVELMEDSETEEELIDFVTWNAHSMYFLDPAKNVVEFIGRHNLKVPTTHHFSGKSLMEISEVGFPVADVEREFFALHNFFDMGRYSGDFQHFCAAGTEHGLFILVPRDRNWFPTNVHSEPHPLELEVSHAGRDGIVKFDGNHVSVSPNGSS